MKLSIHRKEQWDLNCYPWLCIHANTVDLGVRIFCVWKNGIQIGNLTLKWRWR